MYVTHLYVALTDRVALHLNHVMVQGTDNHKLQ